MEDEFSYTYALLEDEFRDEGYRRCIVDHVRSELKFRKPDVTVRWKLYRYPDTPKVVLLKGYCFA